MTAIGHEDAFPRPGPRDRRRNGGRVESLLAIDFSPGALSGSYGGVTASATVGNGAGANVLVGWLEQHDCLAAGQRRRHDWSQCCRGRCRDDRELSA